MIGLVKILQKKISDKNIRTLKTAFGFIYILSLSYNLLYQGDTISNSFLGFQIAESNTIYIKYLVISFGIIPIISGIWDISIWKSKYARIFQIFSGIMLFYIAGLIVDSPKLEVDTLIGVMGVFPLIGGITGKLITTKASKYGYAVTKIRV